MGNFDFVRQTMPELHDDCARAESYLAADPRSACFYARRVGERLVERLYEVLGLRPPYQRDFAALIHDPAFARAVGPAIKAKLNLLRKLGNVAVHDGRPVRPDTALQALRDLHHVMVWAGYEHSSAPEASPVQAAFDPDLAKRSAPLSRDEVSQLAERFAAQDAAHARALATRDAQAAELEREIAELRAQVAAAQDAKTLPFARDLSEAATRDAFIDLLLREADWPLDDPRDTEFPVHGMPGPSGDGYVDYVLWGADGRPLALIEAKKTGASPEYGKQQALLYAHCLERDHGRRPVIFLTNGAEHWIWDDARGYPPRPIHGFLTRSELERIVSRRDSARPLIEVAPTPEIAGRPYQLRAIRAVGDAFEAKQRDALLVMATGSGKTRTVVALVDQLMRAGWVQRVLFLADRTALVQQAAGVFRTLLPSVPTVNLISDRLADGRVYASTYQTMLGLINETDEASGVRRFVPGFFDLIVIDEAHRSVYARYGAVFEYFDALLLGLTATPKDEIDRNTYRLFHLEDGVPTDAYSLEDAVADGYLVPPVAVSVGTKFLRRGIRYDELSEAEKDDWDAIEWGDGEPPEAIDPEELNRFLFNADTVDKVLATLMRDGHTVDEGERLAKTIIFAKNQDHAEFIERRFNAQYPELGGQAARVITYRTSHAQSLIDAFSDPSREPSIAISVDMLDTGIDVPEVANLVFFKLVRSKAKFWQMIGRGTRLRPDLYGPGRDKTDFFVFDFCGNLEFFSQDLPEQGGSTQKSLTQRLVEARMALLQQLDAAGDAPGADVGERGSLAELRGDTVDELRAFVAGMTLDNVLVRPHRRAVERLGDDEAWRGRIDLVATELLEVAGLPSAHRDADVVAKRFDLVILERQLAQLEGDVAVGERCRVTVQRLAEALLASSTAIPAVSAEQALLEEVASDAWWVGVTLPMLESMRRRLRGLMRFIERRRREPVFTDFQDELEGREQIALPHVTPNVDYERFLQKARAWLREHENDLALQKVRRNRQLTTADLHALEALLVADGIGEQRTVERAARESGGLGLFIRSLVGLERDAAKEAFAEFLSEGAYSASQIRYIELIIDELTANGAMEARRLFESPYTDLASSPTSLFDTAQVTSLVARLEGVRRTAEPPAQAQA
ncbi:Putative DNA repair helicase RadD [Pseudoclavibacter triregionum]|nr:Putative DNA repair helicase RadD [Pseudoclavibacter triregionum]